VADGFCSPTFFVHRHASAPTWGPALATLSFGSWAPGAGALPNVVRGPPWCVGLYVTILAFPEFNSCRSPSSAGACHQATEASGKTGPPPPWGGDRGYRSFRLA